MKHVARISKAAEAPAPMGFLDYVALILSILTAAGPFLDLLKGTADTSA